jgi:hypothetical protein
VPVFDGALPRIWRLLLSRLPGQSAPITFWDPLLDLTLNHLNLTLTAFSHAINNWVKGKVGIHR